MSESSKYLKFKEDYYAHIRRFYQCDTYYGVLEGVPDTKINAGYIESYQDQAKRLFNLENVHLIEPEQRIFSPETPFRKDENGKDVFKASLPSVVCMAELGSSPVHNEDCEWSKLVLVWFQDSFALPVCEEVKKQIEILDWKELSVDKYE